MSDDPLGKFCDYTSKDDLLAKCATRIAELEAALIDCITTFEGWRFDVPALRQALKVLGEKE